MSYVEDLYSLKGETTVVIGAATRLASEKASSFVTGVIIRVDGGFTAMTI